MLIAEQLADASMLDVVSAQKASSASVRLPGAVNA
jgi:hypothetical protein